jgi:hypothetical protein
LGRKGELTLKKISKNVVELFYVKRKEKLGMERETILRVLYMQ